MYQITQESADTILQYLVTRPYMEVHALIDLLYRLETVEEPDDVEPLDGVQESEIVTWGTNGAQHWAKRGSRSPLTCKHPAACEPIDSEGRSVCPLCYGMLLVTTDSVAKQPTRPVHGEHAAEFDPNCPACRGLVATLDVASQGTVS